MTNPGALWHGSRNFYPRVGGTPHLGAREWRWRRGGKIKFSHLQFEITVLYDWQGAQDPAKASSGVEGPLRNRNANGLCGTAKMMFVTAATIATSAGRLPPSPLEVIDRRARLTI
jgi:hypothetical protein